MDDTRFKEKVSVKCLLKDQFGSHNDSFLKEGNVSTYVLCDFDWLLVFSDGIWFNYGKFDSMQDAFWC
jgi:hypothetical protein